MLAEMLLEIEAETLLEILADLEALGLWLDEILLDMDADILLEILADGLKEIDALGD